MRLPEAEELARLIEALGTRARVTRLATVSDAHHTDDVLGLALGAADTDAPCLVLVGGVHGVERIGAEVVLAHLRATTERLGWDAVLVSTLERARLVYVPIVNPSGMRRGTRANARGVDLMRNAPRHPESRPTFLVGGQRLGPMLPWFVGREDGRMEPESEGLCAYVTAETSSSRATIVVDCHSGFGLEDRLWFPYARTRRPFPGLAEVTRLGALLDRTLAHHVYRLEPQAGNYTTIGDLWDHLYDRHLAEKSSGTFLPLTLEMGSWTWLRKNPSQALSPLGAFHPIVPHRHRRTLRRHLPLFDFLLHAVVSHDAWISCDAGERRRFETLGFRRWYADR